jgi:hypothetical protein
MNPPKALIDKMLADGPKGLLVSMLCLMVAHAVKKGDPIETIDHVELQDPVTHQPWAPDQLRAARVAMRACYEDLSTGTPLQVDHAIALYTAHLKAAGFCVEVGRFDN